MPRKAKTDNSMDFEKAMQDLETLVEKMESGDLSLDESLHLFEQGVKLTRQCQQSLKEAEQKVSILLEKDKNLALSEFDNN